MSESVPSSIAAHFRQLPHPRVRRTRRHALEWFREFLALPQGIPSHDTFGRVFAALDPEPFKAACLAWVATVADLLPGDVIAIDAKTLRHTYLIHGLICNGSESEPRK